MPDNIDYVEGLSGEEIVIDLCSLVAEKLRKDCNLRESDSYMGGYMAKVTIHLEAYGMDTAVVDAEVSTGKAQDNPDEMIDTALEVPVEPALDLVRERSEQPVPTLSMTEQGEPVIRKRRYVRAQGAALGAPLE